jgi:hypothetical protein
MKIREIHSAGFAVMFVDSNGGAMPLAYFHTIEHARMEIKRRQEEYNLSYHNYAICVVDYKELENS